MNEENKSEIALVEVVATKINLAPGDTLMVTLKHDDVEFEELQYLKKGFEREFPNNKIFLFNVGIDGDLKFTVASKEEVSYCSDCSCGKKKTEKETK